MSQHESPPEMHCSLRIPEVIAMICSQLEPAGIPWTRIRKARGKDLAVLARTCTSFHDAALDALWNHQDTLMNLVRCMPADLWKVLELPEALAFLSQGKVKQSRPIVASDWDRLLKYAPRIKSLRVDDKEPNLVLFFEALRLRFPNDYVLPNLQHLAWGYSSAASFGYARSVLPFIDLFLGPRISSFGIARCERDAHYSILPDLVRKYPRLSTVAIGRRSEDDNGDEEEDDEDSNEDGATRAKEPVDPGPPIVDQLSAFVRELTHVQALVVGVLDRAALIHLGELNTLKILDAQLPVSLSFPANMHRTLFSRLQFIKLEIDQGDIQGFTQLIRTWNNAPLGSFEIELTAEHRRNFTEPVFLQPVEEFHSLLGEHCQPDSLTKFSFDIPRAGGYDDFGTFVYPGRFLRSLFCFGKLTSVTIRVIDGFDIDDATVCDLALAWPCLRLLSLRSSGRAPPRATLRGLQALAQHCPELHTLAVTFDATDLPPHVRITQRKLVSLDVGDSLITAPILVAQFLASTFGALKQTIFGYGQDRPRWLEVENLLSEIRKKEDADTQNSTSTGVSPVVE
ncbi:hypothetical protein C8R47DRAFT_1155050 [Mycena vitilis]|nr:hypothetical protein C8R47DRAFT_1155050 [Mycena vitilis]